MSTGGTLIKPRYSTVYFDNIDAENKGELKSKKSEILKNINEIKSNILALCMSTPKDITDNEEYSDPFAYVRHKFNEFMDYLREYSYDLDTIEIIENLLDEWEYGSYIGEKELYKNNEINPFVKNQHSDFKLFKKNSFTLTPDDNSIIDIFNRCKKNIEYNREQINLLKDKYIIIFDNDIFSDYTGQFIFSSPENAKKSLYEKFDLRIHDYINKEFIKEKFSFFTSFNNVLSKEDYDLLIILLNEYADDNGFTTEGMKKLETIYNLLNKGIDNMLINHIKIIKLYDLINLFKIQDSDYKDITKKIMTETILRK